MRDFDRLLATFSSYPSVTFAEERWGSSVQGSNVAQRE